jgi:DnaJ-class molecular chaperone
MSDNPADRSPSRGTQEAGDVWPDCEGTGQVDDTECETCGGTGKLYSTI